MEKTVFTAMKEIVQTERLLLRQFGMQEAHLLMDLNDEDVLRFTGDKPFTSLEEAEDALDNIILPQYKLYGHGRWAVFVKETGIFTGWCGLKYLPAKDEIDLGYRLLKKYRGRGYATEAAKASLDYGFNQLKIKTITARAVKANVASINVIKKIGMNFKAESDHHGKPSVIYELNYEEYKSRKVIHP